MKKIHTRTTNDISEICFNVKSFKNVGITNKQRMVL